MATYLVEVRICDDNGANCGNQTFLVPAEDLPFDNSMFGLTAGSPEYWDVANSFLLLMAVIWAAKFLVRFVTGRR